MYMRNRITLSKINRLLLAIMLLLGSLGMPIPGAARAIAEPGAQSGVSPTPPAAPSRARR